MKSSPVCTAKCSWCSHDRKLGRRQAARKIRRRARVLVGFEEKRVAFCSNPFRIDEEVLMEDAGWEMGERPLRRLTHSLAAPDYRFWAPDASKWVKEQMEGEDSIRRLLDSFTGGSTQIQDRPERERVLRLEWRRLYRRK